MERFQKTSSLIYRLIHSTFYIAHLKVENELPRSRADEVSKQS